MGEQLQPEKIVLDFEIAVMIAVGEEFPGVLWGGCFFYMLQSLWRNAAQHGMKSLFKKGVVHKDEDESPYLLRSIVFHISRLAFMPHAYVCALFQYLCASASVQDEIGKHPDVDMIGYVRESSLVQMMIREGFPFQHSCVPEGPWMTGKITARRHFFSGWNRSATMWLRGCTGPRL
jgi:hypothetical protein